MATSLKNCDGFWYPSTPTSLSVTQYTSHEESQFSLNVLFPPKHHTDPRSSAHSSSAAAEKEAGAAAAPCPPHATRSSQKSSSPPPASRECRRSRVRSAGCAASTESVHLKNQDQYMISSKNHHYCYHGRHHYDEHHTQWPLSDRTSRTKLKISCRTENL